MEIFEAQSLEEYINNAGFGETDKEHALALCRIVDNQEMGCMSAMAELFAMFC